MKKVLFLLACTVVPFLVQAIPLRGIQIESSGELVVIFLEGEQVSEPTHSCFIANLNPGSHRIKVIEAGRKKTVLFDQRVVLSGRRVEKIVIGGNPGGLPGEMNPANFSELIRKLKEAPFKKDKMGLLDTALPYTSFTSLQCKEIAETFTFDKERKEVLIKLYPSVRDPQNYFRTLETLTFSSTKREIEEYIKAYNEKEGSKRPGGKR